MKYKALTRSEARVRGDEAYNVDSVDETVRFATNTSARKPSAAAALQEITGSTGQRSATSEGRVTGFTDARGSTEYNQERSEKRAEALKNYRVSQGKTAAARVSVEPMGDA